MLSKLEELGIQNKHLITIIVIETQKNATMASSEKNNTHS